MSLKTHAQALILDIINQRIKAPFQGLLIIKWFNQVSNNPRYQSNHNTSIAFSIVVYIVGRWHSNLL